MENKNDSNEMNLLQLLKLSWNGIVKGVKGIVNFTGLTLQLMMKHWVATIIVVLVCVLLGQYLARPSARKYKAGAVAMLYGSNVATAKEVSSQLQNSIANEPDFSLAHKLGVSQDVAKNIVGIDNFNVIDFLKDGTQDMIDFKKTHSLTDTLNLVMQDRLYIQVITKNISQLPIVQNALLNYFNHNSIMMRKFETEKANLNDKINLCDKEIARLDSLAKVSYFKDADKKISFEDNRLIVGEQKKQLFYGDVLNLQDIKANTQASLINFVQPMNFTSGLIVNPTPINSRIKYLIYSLIIGIIVGGIFVHFAENWGKIVTYLNSKS